MSDGINIVPLVTMPTDADKAEALKVRFAKLLAEVCAGMDEANAAGFVPEFGLGHDMRGKNVIVKLVLAKHY